jgi:hypothetical protein
MDAHCEGVGGDRACHWELGPCVLPFGNR